MGRDYNEAQAASDNRLGSGLVAGRDTPVAELEKSYHALSTAIDELMQRLMPFMKQENEKPSARNESVDPSNDSAVAGTIRGITQSMRLERSRILGICRNFDL